MSEILKSFEKESREKTSSEVLSLAAGAGKEASKLRKEMKTEEKLFFVIKDVSLTSEACKQKCATRIVNQERCGNMSGTTKNIILTNQFQLALKYATVT